MKGQVVWRHLSRSSPDEALLDAAAAGRLDTLRDKVQKLKDCLLILEHKR